MPRNFKLIFSSLILASFFSLSMALLCGVAAAETYLMSTLVCVDAGLAKKELAEKFGETVVGMGIDYRGNLTELFISDHTWTLVRITPQGQSCAYASGNDWEMLKPEVKGTKS